MIAGKGGNAPQFDRRAIPREAVESRWSAPGGAALRRIDWLMPPGACRGSLLFMPGRGDAYEKYLETLDHWHRLGWRVTNGHYDPFGRSASNQRPF